MANEGVAPVDFSTDVGLTRALLGDTDAENIEAGIGEYTWFSDDEITAVLGLYSDSPRRAAARLLLTVASSQALLLKRWSADDLSVQGDAIAESLRRIARDLNNEEEASISSTDIFEIASPMSDSCCQRAEASTWPYPLSSYSCGCEIC